MRDRLDGRGGQSHAEGGARREETEGLFDAGGCEGEIVEEGGSGGDQGGSFGGVGGEDRVVLCPDTRKYVRVGGKEEDDVGNGRGGCIVAAEKDGFDIVDG